MKMSIAAAVLLASCVPGGHSGLVVRVDNQCSERVGFVIDGESPPLAPQLARSHLEPSTAGEPRSTRR